MTERYLGESIKKLGFGLMRLPKCGQEIDIERTKRMVDMFMARGFTYFDTAYVYDGGKSEEALRKAVVERYPRDSFVCASKLPLWDAGSAEDLSAFARTSLERAGLEYFDFYLIHALSGELAEKADRLGAWGFMKEWKASGRAKHIGFSFHDSPEALERILAAHPEMEFVQLQINYKDWEDEKVQSRRCYETARKYGRPVVVMEPVKGGSLVTMTEPVREIFRSAAPDMSVASWALRFAAGLEGIVTVLSGMSSEEQMDDNTSCMANFRPLTQDERRTIERAVEAIDATPTVPCTACRYCVDGCPMHINIPGVFRAYNELLRYGSSAAFAWLYGDATREGGKAPDCVGCGRCAAHCPQHIDIPRLLSDVAARLP